MENMLENKYYQPTIEEFYVGFEFEFYDDDDHTWNHTKIKYRSELYNWTAFDDIHKRIKYLDKDDIESLGFEYDVNDSDKPELGFLRDTNYLSPYTQYVLRYNPVNKNFKIERIVYCSTGIGDYLFNGTIKNKSELIKLLKMLNINA